MPAYQAGLLLLTLLLSGWVLQEFKAMTFDDEVLFWLGAIIVGFGMLLNAWGLAKSAEAKRKEEEAALGDEALVDAGLAGSKVPWEDEYPGGNDDPESAKEARTCRGLAEVPSVVGTIGLLWMDFRASAENATSKRSSARNMVRLEAIRLASS